MPFVEEHRAARAVGQDEVGLVRGHRFELFLGVGDRIAAVGHHQVIAESESAAVPPLRIVDHFAAPRLNHSGQHVREFRSADTDLRENFRIVAADVFDAAQRFSGFDVDQFVFGFRGDLFAVVENHVGRVRQVFRLFEFAAGSFIKVVAGLLFQFREVVPHFERFGIDAERRDARRDEILVPRFGHQRELPRHDRHDRFERHDVGMVADAGAGGVTRVFVDVPTQVVAQDI